MNALERRIQQIEKGIDLLIKNNADIKSIVSIGSYATNTIDKFSDIDLYIFTTKPQRYLNKNNISWLSPIGDVMSRRIFKDFKEGVDKNKLIVENGLMYDLTIVSVKRFKIIKYFLKFSRTGFAWILPKFLKRVIESNILRFVQTVRRGYKIHSDNIDLNLTVEGAIKFANNYKGAIIGVDSFLSHYNTFWQSCYTASIKLIRKEFYHTILVYDHQMKHELLWIIERGELINNNTTDVFYNGFNIHKWGKNIQGELYDTLFHTNIIQMQQSLLKSIELYQHFSLIVAEKYNFPLNKDFEKFVINFIKNVAIPENEKNEPVYS